MLTVKTGEAMEGKEEEGESGREGERHSTLLKEGRSDTSARLYLAKCERRECLPQLTQRFSGSIEGLRLPSAPLCRKITATRHGPFLLRPRCFTVSGTCIALFIRVC